jgi:hypothetical protein
MLRTALIGLTEKERQYC